MQLINLEKGLRMKIAIYVLIACVFFGAIYHIQKVITPEHQFGKAIRANDINKIDSLTKKYPKLLTQKILRYPIMDYALHVNANTNTVEHLIKLGCEFKKPGIANMTPLLRAIMKGNYDVAKLFLENGADPNDMATSTMAPIHWAVVNNDSKYLLLLLNYGANPNLAEKSKDKWTPLFDAIFWDRIENVKILIDNGANLKLKSKDGKTPLEYAEEKDSTECIDYLKSVLK